MYSTYLKNDLKSLLSKMLGVVNESVRILIIHLISDIEIIAQGRFKEIKN